MRPCNPFRIGLALLLSLSPALKAQHPTLQTPAQPPATPPATAPETPTSTAPTLSVDARLVNLPVVVRDKNGALIQTLTKADFTLQVDNKPQTIRYFDRDTNLPLTLGLLVDTSQSLRSALDDERTASSAFLDQMLVNPKDQAFVVQFARQIELLVVLVPNKYTVYEPLLLEPDPGRGRALWLDEVDAYLQRTGVATLNLTRPMRARAARELDQGRLLYWIDDTHWNAAGIRLAAEEISARLH